LIEYTKLLLRRGSAPASPRVRSSIMAALYASLAVLLASVLVQSGVPQRSFGSHMRLLLLAARQRTL
jgi:hypothetical protein